MTIVRALTDGEIKLCRTLFGDALDYSAVKISDGRFTPFQPEGCGMAPGGRLFMYGCYFADYSREDPWTRALFIHEMTHVWQFQNKILNTLVATAELLLKYKFNQAAYFAEAYPYHLDEKKDLLDYNMEQQASIVQGYFMLKREKKDSSHHCQNTCSDDEKIKLYEKVLEKFLKNPAYAKQDKFPKLFKGTPPKP